MPPCGRFSATTRRVASSIAATADLLSAPRIVPPAFRTTPSSTTGSMAPSGGTVSRWAQKNNGAPSPLGSIRQRRLPIEESILAPASSSSTGNASARRYSTTWSATARSCPEGLGTRASSRNSSATSGSPFCTGSILGGGDRCADPLARAGERSADELPEERRRTGRARLELGMELAGDEPGMSWQLDDFDETTLLEGSRDDEPRVDEASPEVVVDLVAVPVALVDHRLAVGLLGPRSRAELDRLRAEPHRAAEVLDLLLLRQQVDHRIRSLRIHLGRVRSFEPDDMAGVLRDGDVHAQADAEVWNAALAGDPAGEDLALPAARAETPGYEHAVDLLELGLRLLERHSLGVDPAHVDRAAVVNTGMIERLVHRQVGVLELHVLADERDLDLAVSLANSLGQLEPLAEISLLCGQAELLADERVEALLLQRRGDEVEVWDVLVRDDGAGIDVGKERDLLADVGRERPG